MVKRSRMSGTAIIAAAVICGVGAGCQNSNDKAKDYRTFYQTGQHPAAVLAVEKLAHDSVMKKESGILEVKPMDDWSRDAIFYLLEEGSVLRAAGRIEDSNESFILASKKMETVWERPTVEVSKEVQALADNLGALQYDGFAYDHVMANTYLCMNYMQLGDLASARTAADQMEKLQKQYIEKRAGKISDQKEKLSKDRAETSAAESQEVTSGTAQQYATVDALVTQYSGYAAYRNPYSTWLYGVCMMAAPSDVDRVGDLGNAKAALEIAAGMAPDNSTVKDDLACASDAMAGKQLPPVTYVILENGEAPIRGDFILRFPVPTGDIKTGNLTYVKAAFPTLVMRDAKLPYVEVGADGKVVRTEPLCNIDAIIAREFKDELPLVITKTIISAALKATATDVARRAADKSGGGMAGLAMLAVGVVYQEITSKADLRQWATLPKEFQVCKVATPADRTIAVSTPNGQTTNVIVAPGTVNVVFVKSVLPTSPMIISQARLQ